MCLGEQHTGHLLRSKVYGRKKKRKLIENQKKREKRNNWKERENFTMKNKRQKRRIDLKSKSLRNHGTRRFCGVEKKNPLYFN